MTYVLRHRNIKGRMFSSSPLPLKTSVGFDNLKPGSGTAIRTELPALPSGKRRYHLASHSGGTVKLKTLNGLFF